MKMHTYVPSFDAFVNIRTVFLPTTTSSKGATTTVIALCVAKHIWQPDDLILSKVYTIVATAGS